MKFQRIYQPIELWEEVRFNMWGSVENRASCLQAAIEFTGQHKLYGKYMMRVIKEWPISCENALTDHFLNRKAWVGHAAVALALHIPEDITRLAWGNLTSEQQLLANEEAKRAIHAWETAYAEDRRLRGGMGAQMLFPWDTGRSSSAAKPNMQSPKL